MPPPPHTKPENVLKRAQELIGVGQAPAALNLVHEHVTSKRTRNSPIASLEPVMILFVELCVDLRKGKAAKDGLYSYKNTAQNTNVGTIELVLKKFIELSEGKVKEAQEKAEQVQESLESQTGTSTANIDDLEATETPESILLSTVSGEQSKDRTDRAIVTPWLKFLWETYRTVLDILKNNARLEIMYQTTAYQAFEFCQKYTRKTEFRRLCELLRNHLQNAAKYQSQIHALNLSDPDTLQRHLDTRFQQLNVAVELELWQEAFRSVEDIHTLLNLSKRPAKNIMMANYFEKLATIFLVSENYLFHAAAFSRLFSLLRASAMAVASGQSPKKDNPTVGDADLVKFASFSILSALAIPVISTSRSRGALVDVDEARKNKNQRLTNLLGMGAPPSRASLFREIINKGLLTRARPEIRDLYNILEVDFHPLSICRRISPILTQIGSDPEMGKYVAPLQQVILTRLFQQLSQVYESVELTFVMDLAQFPEPFQVSKSTVEKFIMNGCKKGDLAIRIDHASGVLTFDSDIFSAAKALHPGSGAGSAESEVGEVQRLQSTPAEIVRSQLTRLAKTLYITCNYVDPTFNEDQRKARAIALQRAEQNANKEHLDILERRDVIERRKQSAAATAAAKEKEEAHLKRIRQQQQQEAEVQRLKDEQQRRDKQKMEAEQARVQREEIEKQVNELKQGLKGINLEDLDLDDMDTTKIRQIKISALEREKNELTRKLASTGKKIDHLERAYRLEEAKKLPSDYAAQNKRDKEEYETTKEETLKESKEKHEYDVALKRRLARLVPSYETFRDDIRSQRHADFEKRRKAAQKELEAQKQKRIRDHRERKAREKAEREEREKREAEEAERREREEAERAAAEEEKQRKLAEARARREEERAKDQERIQAQLRREEEAAARRAGDKGSIRPSRGFERPSEPVPPTNASSQPPRFTAGKMGGWREREAARQAAGGSDAAPPAASTPEPAAAAPAPAAAPPARGGYVPPHMRNTAAAAGAGSGAGAREGGARWSRGPSGADAPNGRSESPANGGMGARSFSGRGPPAEPATQTPPPAAAAGEGGPQRYRPGAFKRAQQN